MRSSLATAVSENFYRQKSTGKTLPVTGKARKLVKNFTNCGFYVVLYAKQTKTWHVSWVGLAWIPGRRRAARDFFANE
jgi:hypothetical protein